MAKKAATKKEKKEYGIKESKELLQFIFALGKMYISAKKDDGNIDLGDIGKVANLFPVLTPAFDGISNVPAELKDLSADEVKELLIFGTAHLGEYAGTSAETEEKIEACLKAGLALIEVFKVFRK